MAELITAILVVLVGAGLAPVVGWFALTPSALLLGLDAAIIDIVQ